MNQEVFEAITEMWGRPLIVLFDSSKNAKVKNFFSIHSLDLDAFAFLWLEDLLYAFPLFRLIPKVIHKVKASSANIILIALASAKRSWLVSLQNLSTATPWRLPRRNDLLIQGDLCHPQVNHLSLTAWLLSRCC